MKNSYKVVAALVGALLVAPAVSFAQSQDNTQPLTRAQVRHQLVELEAAGYNPNDLYNYPDNIQAAERRVAAEHAQALAQQHTEALSQQSNQTGVASE